MTAMIATNGPAYISSYNADVILSDVRRQTLKIDALNCINVLLDEFLYNILSTAQSLSTDSLRAALLKLLPTSLGKEALLEAEVELRAYWDKTNPSASSTSNDSYHFHLQWSFELLRIKCEAYATLNDTHEDPAAEQYLQQRMSQAGDVPPPPAVMAPAALYLTAIIESMCEHILTSVGAVCSRDSSRSTATIGDLFVALCEDSSIYDLFKSMKVYGQIEQLSQLPKPRRSKSITSREQQLSSTHSQSSLRDPVVSKRNQRNSGESPPVSLHTQSSSINHTSRSSFDKAKTKIFTPNSRSSMERDSEGHQRSESVLSEETQQTWAAFNTSEEDTSILQDFDNLMRSSATMKVSLTPDRLKTMDVFKQEKRGNLRRPTPVSPPRFGEEQASLPQPPPSRANGRRPSLRHEDSIEEDEEESASILPAKAQVPPLPASHRGRSTSSASTSTVVSKITTSAAAMAHKTQRRPPPNLFDENPFPVKTRRIQKNRESLDLDAVMAGSDDEADEPALPPLPKPTTQSGRRPGPIAGKVSASTRDLMDFLNEGPPDTSNVSKSGKELMDFLAQGPADSGLPPITQGGSIKSAKGSGRLQRMMSKLSMGGSDRSKSGEGEPVTPVLRNRPSNGNMILATKPIPPRPPQLRPITPPLSPAEPQPTSIYNARSRAASSAGQRSTEFKSPSSSRNAVPERARVSPPPIENSSPNGSYRNEKTNTNGIAPSSAVSHTTEPAQATVVRRLVSKPAPPAAIVTKPVEPVAPIVPPAPHMSVEDARELRRVLTKATSADECRMIFDMFLAKSSLLAEVNTNFDAPYPSPSPSLTAADTKITPPEAASVAETSLEHSLFELLLNGDAKSSNRKKRTKAVSESAPTSPPTSPIDDQVSSVPVTTAVVPPTIVPPTIVKPAETVAAPEPSHQRPPVSPGTRTRFGDSNGTELVGPRPSRRVVVVDPADKEPASRPTTIREIAV